MTDVLDAIRRAKEAGELDKLAEAIPYARFLGLSAQLRDGELIGILRYDPALIGNTALPALHGGTLGALLETTAVFQVLRALDEVRLPKTINLTVEYLRSGRPVDTFAHAEVTRLGRRVANVRAVAWQEDRNRPIAAANVHVLLGGGTAKNAPQTPDPGAQGGRAPGDP